MTDLAKDERKALRATIYRADWDNKWGRVWKALDALIASRVTAAEAASWHKGYFDGKRDYAGSITGGVPISTPNPYLRDAETNGGE